ncbi:hypothetical protein HII36_10455 [Nonomuraea sp. NN258]|uniref:hypothetical protein n=1 Tax=Nonomuraea antri TaxID=2730852 RepID=UPI00156A2676|nr:hypothetical protein [Nonomuraea antri]NRQ32254.1 hypothetical protein [Nonomuraea antri]
MNLVVVLVAAIVGLALWAAFQSTPVSHRSIAGFTNRERLGPTTWNAGPAIDYFRETRSWRAVGLTAGLLLPMTGGHLTISAMAILVCWFAGVLMSEFRLMAGREKGRPHGLPILDPAASAFHAMTDAGVLVLAGATVVRSLGETVPTADKVWAVAAVFIVAAVRLLIHELKARPLAQGPADLIAVAAAIRTRSARVLATGGGSAALACALSTHTLSDQVSILTGVSAAIVALIVCVRPAAPRPLRRWPGPALATLAAAVTACAAWWTATTPVTPLYDQEGRLAEPALYLQSNNCARPDRGTLLDCATWFAISANDSAALPRAAGRPLAVNWRGTHVVYRDRADRRLVVHALATGARRAITGTSPALSQDGTHVATLTGGGAQIVHIGSGRAVTVPGIARILGFGPGGLVATTGPAARGPAPDVELVTAGLDGRVLTRVPFDPTLNASLTPGGERLLIITDDLKLVLMDPSTGRVLQRTTIEASGDTPHQGLDVVAWKNDGHVVVTSPPSLFDPVTWEIDIKTGRAEEARPAADTVYARVPEDGS